MNSALLCDPICKPISPLDKWTQAGKTLIVSRANPNFYVFCNKRHAGISSCAARKFWISLTANSTKNPTYSEETISFHFISFHFISFHFISFHFISFHFISFHFISFHFISFHFISFHFSSFHFISFHFISFHFTDCEVKEVLSKVHDLAAITMTTNHNRDPGTNNRLQNWTRQISSVHVECLRAHPL